MMEQATSGPFEGLKVLELGRFIAVPFCGQMLAEGGADVIKVEDLDGDQSRHNGPILPYEGRQFFNKNRGKRSLSVLLSDAEVQGAVRTLAARSDIVLANFRPRVAENFGLDFESLRAANPRLIYAQNTAYGLEGALADTPGMDVVMQGVTGFAHLTERGPEQHASPMIDHAAALLMAWGVSTALYHRERTGRGQKLDVALMHAAMILENTQLTHVDLIDGWRADFLAYLKSAFSEGKTWGDVLQRRDELQPHRVMRAYYGFFETADGNVAIACNARNLRRKMAALLQVDDRWTTEKDWYPEDVTAHEAFVREQVTGRLKAKPTAEWIAIFTEAGLPIGPLRHSDEMFDDPQAWENGFLARIEHEVLGGVTVVAPPVKFSDSPLRVRPSVPLGKHSRDVLREAGLGSGAIEALFERGVAKEVRESLEDLL